MTTVFRQIGKVPSLQLPVRDPFQALVRNPALKRIGWTPEDLSSLTHRVKTVLNNFERLTQSGLKFKKINITPQPSQKEKTHVVINVDSQKIHLFFNNKPDEVLEVFEYIPFNISKALTKWFFDQALLDLYFTLLGFINNNSAFINNGITSIENFVKNKRGLQINPAKIRLFFRTSFIEEKDVIGLKFISNLLRPYPLPRVPIENIIKAHLSTLKEEASKVSTDPSSPHPWSSISTLAKLAVIAKKAKIEDVENDCKNVLSEDFGRDLAMLELMRIKSSKDSPFVVYPHQLEYAREGFELLFDFFRDFYDFFYDNFELGKQ